MATDQVSLRLEASLLKRTDEIAKRTGMSRTQLIELALEQFVTRTAMGAVLPAGLSAAFDSYLQSIQQSGGFVTLLVLDPTGRQAWTFSGWIRNSAAENGLASGFVTVLVYEVDQASQGVEVPMARASIVAWEREASRTLRHKLGHFWRATDGNDYVARGPSPMPVPRF